MTRRVGGRPTKLTRERQDTIISMVQAGQFKSTAARAAGVAPDTLSRWLARPGARYRRFRRALAQAEAAAEAELVTRVNTLALADPQIALRLLERRFPQRWSRGPSVVIDIGDGEGLGGDHGRDTWPDDSVESPETPR